MHVIPKVVTINFPCNSIFPLLLAETDNNCNYFIDLNQYKSLFSLNSSRAFELEWTVQGWFFNLPFKNTQPCHNCIVKFQWFALLVLEQAFHRNIEMVDHNTKMQELRKEVDNLKGCLDIVVNFVSDLWQMIDCKVAHAMDEIKRMLMSNVIAGEEAQSSGVAVGDRTPAVIPTRNEEYQLPTRGC